MKRLLLTLLLVVLPSMVSAQATLNDKWMGSFATCTGGVPCITSQVKVATGPLTGALAAATLNDLLYTAFQSCSGTPCLTVSVPAGISQGAANTLQMADGSGGFLAATAATFATSLTGPSITLSGTTAAADRMTLTNPTTGGVNPNGIVHTQVLTSGASTISYGLRDILQYRATDASAGTQIAHTGFSAAGTYGQSGGSPIQGLGTIIGVASSYNVVGTSNALNEYAPYYGAIRLDIGPAYTQTTGPTGRVWLQDLTWLGSIGVQPNLLSGPTVAAVNYYNGSPTAGPSLGMAIVTGQTIGGSQDATHQAATSYAVDIGLAIAGTSTGGNTGFTTAIDIGGTNNISGWNVTTSKIGTGVAIHNYATDGLVIDTLSGTPTSAIRVAGATTVLKVTGTITGPYALDFSSATLAGTNATAQALANFQTTVSPNAGGTLTTLYGNLFLPSLANSSDNITTAHGFFSRIDSAASESGTITQVNNFTSGSATVSGSHYGTLVGFLAQGQAGNGNGKTSGTWVNIGVQVQGATAAAGSGGTVANRSIQVAVPSGNTAGTANRGIYITGNGGASAGSNYALISDSTAPSLFTGNVLMPIPTAQTIAAGNTVTADACGGIKRITASGAVTTDTTNTFTAPAAANAGCVMYVCNVGSNNITLDNNANFKSPGAADVVLGQDDCIIVGSTGASGAWYALAAAVAN